MNDKAAIERLPVLRLTRDGADRQERRIAVETPVAISFFGIGYAVMMATPEDLEDFAIGFSRSERLIDAANEVIAIEVRPAETGILLQIDLRAERRALLFERVRHRVGESSCGLCGIENLDQALRPLPVVPSPPPISKADLFAALEAITLRQPLNRETGAVHAAAFFDASGAMVAVREDIGRHNAFDKLIGHCLRTGVDMASGFALLTSRCSYELVEKAALADIGLLATLSAPTSLAVARAQEAGLTLVALARPDAMLVMNDPGGLFSRRPTSGPDRVLR